jgi:hypothetical protein
MSYRAFVFFVFNDKCLQYYSIFSQGKFPTACGELNMNPEDTPLLAAGSFIFH